MKHPEKKERHASDHHSAHHHHESDGKHGKHGGNEGHHGKHTMTHAEEVKGGKDSHKHMALKHKMAKKK